ncbi:MAG: PDZ domain-containing protein [Bdellovibrionaceae bacterium]|nr:PDZ domain-containing protein [Pseudobdellovibrionaceae bacterium]
MNAKLYSALFSILLLSQLLWAQNQPLSEELSLGKALPFNTFQSLASHRTLTLSTLESMVNDRNCIESLRQYLGCITALQKLVRTLDPALSLNSISLATKAGARIEFSTENLVITRALQPKTETLQTPQAIYNRVMEEHNDLKKQFVPLYSTVLASRNPSIEKIITFVTNKFKGKITEEHIAGTMNALFSVVMDPHASFRGMKQLTDSVESASSSFVGLGVILGISEAGLKINDVVLNSGAHKAGLQRKDIISKVDGKSLKGLDITSAMNLIRGEENSPVTLEIIRNSTPSVRVVVRKKITQEIVQPDPFTVFGKTFGYIKYKNFMYEKGCAKIAEALDLFNKQNVFGAILDLRDNGGGRVDISTCISSLFLGPGKIMAYFEQNTEGQQSIAASVTQHPIVFEKPLAILINENSASASELIAGAMKDYNRALIVGQTSFGKGSAQSPVGKTDSFALYGTTGRFYHPSGYSNQSVGVTPHIAAYKYREPSDYELYALREKDLFLIPLEPARIMISPQPEKLNRIFASQHCRASRNPTELFDEAPENTLLKDWQLVTAAAALGCYDQSLWRSGNL